jgi:hypothetical protein
MSILGQPQKDVYMGTATKTGIFLCLSQYRHFFVAVPI